MTGEALYGEHVGLKMPVTNLLQIDVKQALTLDPAMKIAISERPYNDGERSMAASWSPDNADVELMSEFVETLGEEDLRLDRMEMGLGIWSDTMRRYYPLRAIRANGRYLIDEVEGKKLLVFLDPLTSTPTALYWNTEEFSVTGRDIHLSDGFRIENGQLLDADGNSVDVKMPKQMYSRWYGFALTFPDSEIIQ
jgi:hypothetical protein